MSLDKSEELGSQYTRAYVLTEDNACLLTQISEVNARVDELEEGTTCGRRSWPKPAASATGREP